MMSKTQGRGDRVNHREAHVRLGHVTDYRGIERPVVYDLGALDLSRVGALEPAGVRELEQMIAGYWRLLALSRLRALDIDNVDLDFTTVGEQLAGLLGESPSNLMAVDWAEVGRRLADPSAGDGLGELRRLHALLTDNTTPAGIPAATAPGKDALWLQETPRSRSSATSSRTSN